MVLGLEAVRWASGGGWEAGRRSGSGQREQLDSSFVAGENRAMALLESDEAGNSGGTTGMEQTGESGLAGDQSSRRKGRARPTGAGHGAGTWRGDNILGLGRLDEKEQ